VSCFRMFSAASSRAAPSASSPACTTRWLLQAPVARKVAGNDSRQLIPAALVGVCRARPRSPLWIPAARYLFALVAGSYALLVVLFAARRPARMASAAPPP